MDEPGVLSGLDGWLRRRPWVFDALFALLLAAALGGTSVALLWQAGWPTAARLGVLVALLAAHAAVAARRSAPFAAYAVTSGAMLVLVLAPDVTDRTADQTVPPILVPGALVFPVLLYAVAAYARRPWPLVALAVALVGAGLTTVRLWGFDEWPSGGGWQLFVPGALLASVLAPWGLGRFRAVRAAYVDALEERAQRADERRAERAAQAAAAERARIAREMHDVVAHSLAVIVRQADGGRFAAAKEPARAVEVLGTIATTGRQALTDMRAVLGVLRQEAGGDSGAGDPPGSGPQPTLHDVPALIERVRAAGTPVSLATTGTAGTLDRAASLAAYRVVQEALTNVVRHAADGAPATVRLDWQARGLDITVSNERAGPSRAASPARAQFGLVGMRERVAAVGGHLTAGPDGDGFAVVAHLPTDGAAR